MGNTLSGFIEHKRAAGAYNDLEYKIELRIAAALKKLKHMHDGEKGSRKKRKHESDDFKHLAQAITAEDEAYLRTAKRQCDDAMCKYFGVACARPIVSEQLSKQIAGRVYEMPLLRVTEIGDPHMLYRVGTSYVNKKHLPRGAIAARVESVRAAAPGHLPSAFADAEGFISAVRDPKVFSRLGRLGRRAVLCLVLEQAVHAGGPKGYMKECQGSGPVEADRLRHNVRCKSRLKAWGLPQKARVTAVQTTGTEKVPQHASVKLKYEYVDPTEKRDVGDVVSFQAGGWTWREEFMAEDVARELRREGLGDYVAAYEEYLDEAYEAYNRWAPLLASEGRDTVFKADITRKELPRIHNKLTVNFMDETGETKLGLHRDTPELPPCEISNESVYPEGFLDFTGAELLLANGVLPIENGGAQAAAGGPNAAVLMNGLQSWHTPLPLRPPQSNPNLPMLRVSFVNWTSAGEESPRQLDLLRASPQVCESAFLVQEREALRIRARQCFGGLGGDVSEGEMCVA